MKSHSKHFTHILFQVISESGVTSFYTLTSRVSPQLTRHLSRVYYQKKVVDSFTKLWNHLIMDALNYLAPITKKCYSYLDCT